MTQAQLDDIISLAVQRGFKGPWRPDVQNAFELIYEPDFLKAIWGEVNYWPIDGGECEVDCDFCHGKLKRWQYHAQQMVASEEPLRYLQDNL